MRKTGWAIAAAFTLLLSQGFAVDTTNFANDAFASQISMDSFNQSIRHRLEVSRMAFYGDVNRPPAERYFGSNFSDCKASNFTIWGDGYYTWGKKKDSNGYKYRVGGPVLGFDWSNGPLTVGIATTYNWGKLEGREVDHENKTRTWATTAYAQWNYERFYVNAELSYGYNRFKSKRYEVLGVPVADPATAKYHSNAWNAQVELGARLNWCNFLVEPHIGFRYFHDNRQSFNEQVAGGGVNSFDKRNYHAIEMPLGLDVAYQAGFMNGLFTPRLHFAWIPQFDRRYAKAVMNAPTYQQETSERARHGFELGAGLQTKVYKGISAHVDYNVNMRSKTYEHTLSAGLGMSF